MALMGKSIVGIAKDAEAGRALWEAELTVNPQLTEETFALGMIKYDETQHRQAVAYLMFYGTAQSTRQYAFQMFFQPVSVTRRVINYIAPYTTLAALGVIGYFIMMPRINRMWSPRIAD